MPRARLLKQQKCVVSQLWMLWESFHPLWKAEIKWQQAYLPLRSLLGWQKPAFLPCPYVVFCLCVSVLGVSESQFLLLVKTSITLDEGPSQQSHFNLITQSPISKYSHIMRYWELTFQQMNWGVCGGGWVGDGIQSATQSKRISISGPPQVRLSALLPSGRNKADCLRLRGRGSSRTLLLPSGETGRKQPQSAESAPTVPPEPHPAFRDPWSGGISASPPLLPPSIRNR